MAFISAVLAYPNPLTRSDITHFTWIAFGSLIDRQSYFCFVLQARRLDSGVAAVPAVPARQRVGHMVCLLSFLSRHMATQYHHTTRLTPTTQLAGSDCCGRQADCGCGLQVFCNHLHSRTCCLCIKADLYSVYLACFLNTSHRIASDGHLCACHECWRVPWPRYWRLRPVPHPRVGSVAMLMILR